MHKPLVSYIFIWDPSVPPTIARLLYFASHRITSSLRTGLCVVVWHSIIFVIHAFSFRQRIHVSPDFQYLRRVSFYHNVLWAQYSGIVHPRKSRTPNSHALKSGHRFTSLHSFIPRNASHSLWIPTV